MGEKGNGGHIPVGGARAVRTAGDASSTGLGGSALGSAAATGGGGLLSSLAGEAADHASDIGLGAAEKIQEHREED